MICLRNLRTEINKPKFAGRGAFDDDSSFVEKTSRKPKFNTYVIIAVTWPVIRYIFLALSDEA